MAEPSQKRRPASHSLGIRFGDRVAILSWNRPEWQEADLGILSIGAISVPLYPTSASPQVGYLLAHSASRVCFVEDSEQLGRVLEQRDRLPELEHIVVFDDGVALNDPLLLSFEELRARGAQVLERDPELVEQARTAVTPDDVATIVYTSGTTGPPKGAVLTHANIMATLRSVTEIVPLSPDDRFLSFLPLSHITERSVSHFGLIAAGGETWFARSISTVAEDLPDCRPTIFFAVPRVWEKIREGVESRVARSGGIRGRAARKYLSLAFARARELETGEPMPFHTKLTWLALDATVGAQLRTHLGLDRARIIVSGAAPIHPDLIRWFHGIGLPLAEGYGQTEVALATTLNPPGASRDRYGRSAVTRRVGPHRRRRRDPHQGRQRVPWLLARREGHARDSSTRTAGCARATSARSTITATCASPAARRISSSPRTARTSRRRTSRPTSPPTRSSARPS